jgi:Protein of unknown function (DUF2911)
MKVKINKFAVLGAFAVAAMLFSGAAALADDADQSTRLTFSGPVEIPGIALPAGTYLFKVDPDNQNVVLVFNADGTRLYTTIQTIAAQREKPTADPVVTLAQQSDGNPEVLVKWFYPGRNFGHEFVYSQHEEQQLAQARQHTIDAGSTPVSGD